MIFSSTCRNYKQKEKLNWVSRYIDNISIIEKLEKSFDELRFRLFINSSIYHRRPKLRM